MVGRYLPSQLGEEPYLLHWRLSYRDIGRRLGRHHTTISREVKLNGRLMACYRDGFAQSVRWFDARNRGTLTI
ncbi:helix-turn-helix domain-containing protein [Candidatus Vondammii sp. HM_W22]|uniref:helix-turn-helix domain-containing protein n=1 Tax=Candidatus Vondammii sp. HM_W22 TaxID=2687299 RepID=UPI00403DC389